MAGAQPATALLDENVYANTAPADPAQFEALLQYVHVPAWAPEQAAQVPPFFAQAMYELPPNHPARQHALVLGPGEVTLLIGQSAMGWWRAHTASNAVGWVHQFCLKDLGFDQTQFDACLAGIPRPPGPVEVAPQLRPFQAKIVRGSRANDVPVQPEQVVWVAREGGGGWWGVVDAASNQLGYVHKYCLMFATM